MKFGVLALSVWAGFVGLVVYKGLSPKENTSVVMPDKKEPKMSHYGNNAIFYEDNFAPGMRAFYRLPNDTNSYELPSFYHDENSAAFDLRPAWEHRSFSVFARDRDGNNSQVTELNVIDGVITSRRLPK